MNLLSKNMEEFRMMNASRTEDGQSGSHTVWTEGSSFQAHAVSAQSRMQAAKSNADQVAKKPEAIPEYTIFTKRFVCLPFHSVVKRVSDGRFFRILSDSADSKTPDGSHLDLRMHAAEKCRLAGEVATQASSAQTIEGGDATDDQS